MYVHVLIYMDGKCHKSCLGFKWVENKFQFSKDFIEIYNKDSNEGYFFEFVVEYLE